MTLSDKQKKFLRGLGHALGPVVLIGDKGLSESVLAEIEAALAHHELIKVKARGRDRASRLGLFGEVSERTGAELVQTIGGVALLYRPDRRQPRIELPRG